jgi:uncharacterized protein YyaL (SSP411 family)
MQYDRFMYETGLIRSIPGRLVPGLLLLCMAFTGTAATEPERTGGWRLALESSPYLRMHANNPVEWLPWGEAAFEKARRENRPLFISIGYFTCHWCHVMARESFSNAEIAGLLNAGFVSIKIDREQRPDLDDVYMSYVQATRGQGGWPLSVFATPDGKPFFGGSYFPPADDRGHPGMMRLLNTIRTAWQQDRAGIEKTAGKAVTLLQALASSAAPLDTLTAAPLLLARKQLARGYDELLGGFGEAPKFPQPARLLFLLQDSEQASADMALHTLDAMAAGGIHDQLGGGFHRYATDAEWRVPHFEQMLYDQALIARAYLQAFRRTRAERYADTVRRVLDFTLAELHDPGGGFYSALSADSPVAGDAPAHLEEGAYYVWSREQLTQALQDPVLLEWAAARYGVTELGESHGEVAGKNVLHVALDDKALAQRFGVDEQTTGKRNAEVEARLHKARARRPAVPVDDKVVTVWNGYMITTLAMAGQLLEEPRYIEAAAAAAGFVLDKLYDDKDVLYRDWRQGQRGVPAFAEDYAALAEGLLTLHQVTGEQRWLTPARRLVDTLLERFQDAEHGGFYSTAADSELWVREKTASDGATLSVNGLAVHALLELAAATGQRDYREQAVRTAAWAGAQLADAPAFMPYILIRWPELLQAASAGRAESDADPARVIPTDKGG